MPSIEIKHSRKQMIVLSIIILLLFTLSACSTNTQKTDSANSNDTIFNIKSNEAININGIIAKTNTDFPKYCIKLDKPITIQISNQFDAEKYTCSALYFYDDNEVNGNYDFDSIIGQRCNVISKIENYRGAGRLFLLEPHIKYHGKEVSKKESSDTYTADYKWWRENAYPFAQNSTISYFECQPLKHYPQTRYLRVIATDLKNGSTDLCFYITENDGRFRKFIVNTSSAKFIDFSTSENASLSDELSFCWEYIYTTSNDKINVKYLIKKSGKKDILILSDNELHGLERPLPYSGTYIPTANSPK